MIWSFYSQNLCEKDGIYHSRFLQCFSWRNILRRPFNGLHDGLHLMEDASTTQKLPASFCFWHNPFSHWVYRPAYRTRRQNAPDKLNLLLRDEAHRCHSNCRPISWCTSRSEFEIQAHTAECQFPRLWTDSFVLQDCLVYTFFGPNHAFNFWWDDGFPFNFTFGNSHVSFVLPD
jgi:hypothetical protein